MPELPEVETTRRGLVPHVVGRRIATYNVYDPRLALAGSPRSWKAPRRAARSIAIDRRSKYLLFRLGGETLLVHLGMTGSLRAYARRACRGARTITSTSFSTTASRCATTIRAVSAPSCGSPARAPPIRCWRSSGRSPSTPRSTRPTCGRRRDGARAAHQARTDGQSPCRRRREHLRQRIAVPRRHTADDARQSPLEASPRAPRRRGPRDARRRDRQGRVDAARLRRQRRRARAISSSSCSSTDARASRAVSAGAAIRTAAAWAAAQRRSARAASAERSPLGRGRADMP